MQVVKNFAAVSNAISADTFLVQLRIVSCGKFHSGNSVTGITLPLSILCAKRMIGDSNACLYTSVSSIVGSSSIL